MKNIILLIFLFLLSVTWGKVYSQTYMYEHDSQEDLMGIPKAIKKTYKYYTFLKDIVYESDANGNYKDYSPGTNGNMRIVYKFIEKQEDVLIYAGYSYGGYPNMSGFTVNPITGENIKGYVAVDINKNLLCFYGGMFTETLNCKYDYWRRVD